MKRILALALLVLLFAVPAGATVWPDSLYIVKPGDSLQWGAKVIGGASVTRTVRLLNHSPDTLIGTVYSSNACYTLNGAVKDTLQYVIPDTTGVFEFTVTFTPAYRGVIDAWLYTSDPFDSVALFGSASGGNSPRPMGVSLYGTSPFSNAVQSLDAYVEPQTLYASGAFPIILYDGATLDEISLGCLRAHITSVTITPDTTAGFMTWHTDSACTGWHSYQGMLSIPRGNGTTHTDTLSGLPAGTLTNGLVLHNARPLDLSCQVDTAVSFTTLCGALSSPIDFEIEQGPDSGFIAYWDTRTETTDELRYRRSTDFSWTEGWIPGFPALTHAVYVAVKLEPSAEYYVEVDGYDACDAHKGWSDSLTFWTDGDTFVTSCPPILESAKAVYVAATSAKVKWNSDYSTAGEIRYGTLAGSWTSQAETGPDSLTHFAAISGLSGSTDYKAAVRDSFPGCTWGAWGDSIPFTTLSACPTVTTSNFATQAISTTGATLHFHTDYDVLSHFKYALYASSSYTYRSGGTDSAQSTVAVTGLTTNHTRYKWLVNTKYTGCDSTAFGDQQDFYTKCDSCGSGIVSAAGGCYASAVNQFEFTSARTGCAFEVKWVAGGTTHYKTVDSGAGTTCHYFGGLGTLDASSTVSWSWRVLTDECGTGHSWVVGGGATTDSGRHFTNTSCACGGE
jgi:hypothetical protein